MVDIVSSFGTDGEGSRGMASHDALFCFDMRFVSACHLLVNLIEWPRRLALSASLTTLATQPR